MCWCKGSEECIVEGCALEETTDLEENMVF
jgi:hypothetical protein